VDNINLSSFTDSQQDAIIGNMLKDRHFFLKCVVLLKYDWFINPLNSDIFKQCQSFFDQFKRQPTGEELKDKFNRTHADTYRKYHDRIDLCILTSKNFGLDFISTEMTGWMKMVMFRNSMEDAADIFRKQDWSAALTWLDFKINEVKQTSFLDDKRITFADSLDFLQKRDTSFEDCLTIGHPDFDELLLEGAAIKGGDRSKPLPKFWTTGGLVKGDSTMILGPSNSGKTTTLTSIIVPNILNNKYILYMTHEQKWEDIKTKILMNAVGATNKELRHPTPDLIRRIKAVAEKLEQYLVYIPWIKVGNMWVESVIAEVNMQQESLHAKYGVKFDMLIDDYPGKLKSQQYKGRAVWEEADYVYDQFVTMATEHRFHAILPVQTNREGYKVNRGDASDGRVIDQADAAGSFGVMQKADNVITLNRSPEDQQYQVMRFYISKSRSSQAQTMFASRTDFAKSITHGFEQSSGVFRETSEGFSSSTVRNYFATRTDLTDRAAPRFIEEPTTSSVVAAEETIISTEE
jgi:KaiC/GvpD/RAD55 family RecA-like ATPase